MYVLWVDIDPEEYRLLVHVHHSTFAFNSNVVCGMCDTFEKKKGITVVSNDACIPCFDCHLFVKLFCEFVNIFFFCNYGNKRTLHFVQLKGLLYLFFKYLLPVQINKCTKECLFSSWIWNNALLFIFAGLWLVSNHGAPHTILFQHDITHSWRKKTFKP